METSQKETDDRKVLTDPLRRNLTGWRLRAYWVTVAPWRFRRAHVRGRSGWVLLIRQPNGGLTSIPARTRVGAWRRLLKNRTGMGYIVD